MSRKARLALAALAGMVLLGPLCGVIAHMPAFGDHPLTYGDLINSAAPYERHVTNMVSAVNFDYRGIDTLGEEFMLVCAVTGTVVLLRGNRGEQLDADPGIIPGRPHEPRSDAIRLVGRWFACAVVLFGAYVALHAMTTPGGGFQGGVIMASGMLLIFVGEGYREWRRAAPSHVADAVEGAGAGMFALAGLYPMWLGKHYLANTLPAGKLHDVFSGGLMQIVNAGVSAAVTGGILVLFIEFLEETRMLKKDDL
jgi:multicomponent Na+:H+ antiporter subunit B